jgi:integrase
MRDYPRPKESTCVHYEERVAAFVADFGSRYLADIDRVEARAWSLENRGRWKVVRAMFSDAVRDGLAEHNPFINMRLGDTSRGRRDLIVPTPEEVDALCEQACVLHGDYGTRIFQHLIRTAAYTGMRPGELYGLRWDDIDFAANTIHVQRQYNIKVRKLTLPKNGLTRVIYMSPPAAASLRAVPRQSDEYVFCTPQGKRYTGTVNFYYWTPVRNAIGRPDWDFYSLRHFYGTHLANKGLSAPDIAQALGHTDGGKLALSRYIHVAGKDSRARIAAAFGSNVVDIRDRSVANG